MSALTEQARAYWDRNQPGFKFNSGEPGTPEFFRSVERFRYALEPATPEMANFSHWRERDVVEIGCGIATDGINFPRNGARYTGVDRSPVALEFARTRFAQEQLPGDFREASATDLPLQDESVDLAYSCGVIHHFDQTQQAIEEMFRVLRPGGTATVMVYHRSSLNYHVTIMGLRRVLAALLLLRGGVALAARATGESEEVLAAHRELLNQHGLDYLRDKQLFLNNNTDGPGNPVSKAYTAAEITRMFHASGFATVRTDVRYLNLRTYPGGLRMANTRVARRLERRWGWHLWVHATKAL